MKLAHPELRSRLASEYVLGTMRGRTRRRFEEYLKRDAALRAEVVRWEERLTPLAARLAPVDPPARVWQRIESRLDRAASRRAAVEPLRRPGLWHSLVFWRNLGLAASVVAATLFVLQFGLKPAKPDPILTAVLAEEANNAVRLFIEQPKANVLNIKMVKPWANGPEKQHQLWVYPANGGAPRPVAIINSKGDTLLNLSELDSKLIDGAQFAVSIEAAGGSQTGMPGRIVCRGTIAWIPKRPPLPPKQT